MAMTAIGYLLIIAGAAFITCQGHKYSMEETDTTVISLDEDLDKVALYKARYDPKVAAILRSFGISKEEEYVYQGNRRIKRVSYVISVSDAEEAKQLVKKLTEVLPEFLDDDDKQLIDSLIDDKLTKEREERQVVFHCAPGTTIETTVVVKERSGFLGLKVKKKKTTTTHKCT